MMCLNERGFIDLRTVRKAKQQGRNSLVTWLRFLWALAALAFWLWIWMYRIIPNLEAGS